MISIKTNIEVGRELVSSLYRNAIYEGAGLFSVKNDMVQHWSYMLLQYISLHHKEEYIEISKRIDVNTNDIKNESVGSFSPNRKLSEVEMTLLWHFYCTRIKLEDSTIVTIGSMATSQVKNEIEADRLRQIELLKIEERELEIKINFGGD
jgi:hypothetical protein